MNDDQLLDVAAAILDGAPVDWPDADAAGDADRAVLDRLRVLARISDVHRRAQDPPTRWGHFVIVELIGSGTFGDVYRASDLALDRDVALKLLRTTGANPQLTEGRLLARVRHPNVVTVHGADEHDGIPGIWMEFVKGRTMTQLVVERGPFPPGEVLAIALDLCRALTAVHGSGLLHGDIKAQNVMREEGGRIVLMDFGTGRLVGDDALAVRVAGTPLYMAPEMFEGQPADHTSDVYSLGVLLYLLLTGTFPIEGRTLDDVRDAHRAGSRVPVRDRRPDVPRHVAAIVDRAIAPKAGRFQTAAEFEAAVRHALQPAIRRHWRAAFATAAGVAIAAALGWRLATPPINAEDLRIQLTPEAAIASDASGAVVWRHAFDRALRINPAPIMNKQWRGLGGRNPSVIVIYPDRFRNAVLEGGAVLQLDAATGKARRSFSFDDTVTIGGAAYGPPWMMGSMAVDDQSGKLRIAVSAHHANWDASLVTILDESFQRRGTYVQAGWIESLQWLTPDRLLIGGFNNARDGGMVALLDPDHLDGQAPELPGTHYYCDSCSPNISPLRIAVMPRSEVNRATTTRHNRASFQTMPDRIVTHTIEVWATGAGDEAIDALYEFTPMLEPLRAGFAPQYWTLHDRLFEQGKLTHRRDDCPDRNGPREVLTWDAANPGWKRFDPQKRNFIPN